MLLRAVPERALAALLGSELVADTLCRCLPPLSALSAPPKIASHLRKLEEDIRQAVKTDVDERTGKRHRLNELELMAQKLCPPNFFAATSIPAIDAAFDELMAWNDATTHVTVYFKYEHVQRYAELTAELDPTLLVAWRLSKLKDCRKVRHTVETLSTLFVGPLFFDRPFADNHTHLGGISGDAAVLAELILFYQPPEPAGTTQAPPASKGAPDAEPPPVPPNEIRLARVRRLLQAFVGLWSPVFTDEKVGFAAQEPRLLAACPHDAHPALGLCIVDWSTVEAGIVVDDTAVTNRWLLKRLAEAASGGELQASWTWLFMLLWRTYAASNASQTLRALVLLLVADIMALRRQMIMNGKGLRRFTTGYPFCDLRTRAGKSQGWKEAAYNDAARRSFAALGDKAELKISSGNFDEENPLTAQFARVADACLHALRSRVGGAAAAMTGFPSLDDWHFCLHFNRSGKTRYPRRLALWTEAETLKNTLGSGNRWDLALTWRGTGAAPGSKFAPAHFVRALDVAGDETAWPIEVFAPMLRWVRHQERRRDLMGELLVPPRRLHLSVHAGEDYAHPLSGLRHVDETVLFCDMARGDRLGHALAIGIPPDKWLERHGEAVLPVDEHVDNLVWAWHQASELVLTKRLKAAERVLPRLKTRIERFLPYVSWWPAPPKDSEATVPAIPSLENLHAAWKYRRNCPTLILEQTKDMQVGDSKLEIGAPDHRTLGRQIDGPDLATAAGLYVQRANTERDPAKRPSVLVRVGQPRHGHPGRAQARLEGQGPDAFSHMHDHDNLDDKEFMLALQDACIERYARQGISIETNPSSNVYIGQIETHSDHPIFRWSPPNRGDLDPGAKHNTFALRTMPIPVTINTDDQGIIPTTLRMEHHLMHEAALDRGHDRVLVDNWADALRELGLKHFADAHAAK